MPIQILHDRYDVANTIDVDSSWTLMPDQSQASCNQLLKLRLYHAGLSYIYQIVRDAEANAWPPSFENAETAKSRSSSVPLYCLFEWYSVTASNYTDMVARLGIRHGFLAPLPDARKAIDSYTNTALGKVSVFRNKVAAHTADVFPRKTDNRADQELSVLPTMPLVNGRYCVGGIAIGTAGKTSQIDFSWILTEFHEGFVKRYPRL